MSTSEEEVQEAPAQNEEAPKTPRRHRNATSLWLLVAALVVTVAGMTWNDRSPSSLLNTQPAPPQLVLVDIGLDIKEPEPLDLTEVWFGCDDGTNYMHVVPVNMAEGATYTMMVEQSRGDSNPQSPLVATMDDNASEYSFAGAPTGEILYITVVRGNQIVLEERQRADDCPPG